MLILTNWRRPPDELRCRPRPIWESVERRDESKNPTARHTFTSIAIRASPAIVDTFNGWHGTVFVLQT